MTDQWYYARQGQRMGPLPKEQLKQLACSGQLKPTDTVWKNGMLSWTPASQIDGLFPLTPPPAAAAPPPILSEALPPPVPTASTKAACVRNMIRSPMTAVSVALIVSAFLPFVVSVGGIPHFSGGAIVGSLYNAFVIVAASLILRKKHYWVAVAGSSLAFFGWLWMPAGVLRVSSAVIALPIGIWSLVTLRKPEVRQQFQNPYDPLAWAMQSLTRLGLQPKPRNITRVTVAAMCGVYALAVVLPTPSASQLPGKWSGESDGSSIEFFSDNTFLAIEKSGRISGKWRRLDDGRIKIDTEAPLVETALGTVEGNVLALDTELRSRNAVSGLKYRWAATSNGEDAEFHLRRGLASAAKKEYDRAIADFDQAIKLNPNDAFAYLDRGLAWDDKGEYDKAIADFDQAIKLNPNDAFAYLDRGLAWDDKKQYGRAIADYDQSIRLDPNDAFAYYVRGGARYANKVSVWRNTSCAVG